MDSTQLGFPLVEMGFPPKMAVFDIETTELSMEFNDHRSSAALPEMTVGAVAISDADNQCYVHVFYDGNALVSFLLGLLDDEYRIYSFNGVGFDCRVLSQYSDARDIYRLATQHYDLMAIAVNETGHRVSLDSCLRGFGLGEKLKSVTLSNGREWKNMRGRDAPRLWKMGERSAVITYLKEDVRLTLELAKTVEFQERLVWKWRDSITSVRVRILPYQTLLQESTNPAVAELSSWIQIAGLPEVEESRAFDGETYEPKKDYARLSKQLQATYLLLCQDRWWTIDELTRALWEMGYRCTPQGVSARIRDLRKQKYGGHNVERLRLGGGVWCYRLTETVNA